MVAMAIPGRESRTRATIAGLDPSGGRAGASPGQGRIRRLRLRGQAAWDGGVGEVVREVVPTGGLRAMAKTAVTPLATWDGGDDRHGHRWRGVGLADGRVRRDGPPLPNPWSALRRPSPQRGREKRATTPCTPRRWWAGPASVGPSARGAAASQNLPLHRPHRANLRHRRPRLAISAWRGADNRRYTPPRDPFVAGG
jgi:hypothetical protein